MCGCFVVGVVSYKKFTVNAHNSLGSFASDMMESDAMDTCTDLECPVCLEPYNLDTRVPRVLPCSGAHALCTACAVQLRGDAIGGRMIKCPECRQELPASMRINENRGLIASLKAHEKLELEVATARAQAEAAEKRAQAEMAKRAAKAKAAKAKAAPKAAAPLAVDVRAAPNHKSSKRGRKQRRDHSPTELTTQWIGREEMWCITLVVLVAVILITTAIKQAGGIHFHDKRPIHISEKAFVEKMDDLKAKGWLDDGPGSPLKHLLNEKNIEAFGKALAANPDADDVTVDVQVPEYIAQGMMGNEPSSMRLARPHSNLNAAKEEVRRVAQQEGKDVTFGDCEMQADCDNPPCVSCAVSWTKSATRTAEMTVEQYAQLMMGTLRRVFPHEMAKQLQGRTQSDGDQFLVSDCHTVPGPADDCGERSCASCLVKWNADMPPPEVLSSQPVDPEAAASLTKRSLRYKRRLGLGESVVSF